MGPPGKEGPAGPSGGATGGEQPSGGEEQGGAGTAGAAFVGSQVCAGCHSQVSEVFVNSGHHWKLNKVVDGQPPEYPFSQVPSPPEGYTWNDISYVVGGYHWKARFLDQEGYIITDGPGATISNTEYLNQFNLANPTLRVDQGAWSAYKPGQADVPYDCGGCHTTGYSSLGNQDNLPGIVGTWAEPGVQCEACHGPGGNHVSNPQNVDMRIERDSEACTECHANGPVGPVEASNGFIQHHEGYEDLFPGKHFTIDCITCHDPHAGVEQLRQAEQPATRVECASCHYQQAQRVNHLPIATCVDCHMPRLIQNAIGVPERFMGDVRTHRVVIDPDQIGQFSEDGTVLPQIGLDFACRGCHVEGSVATPKTDDVLTGRANGIHEQPPEE
jgi:hypothetical protein